MADVWLETLTQTESVMKGDLLIPQIGNYSAHLVLANAEIAPHGRATLNWLGTSFSGTILRPGENEGRYSCFFVGGKGGLYKQVPAKMYDFSMPASLPISEILSSAGEVLSKKSTLSVLNTTLKNWVRKAGDAASQLDDITDILGCIWRVEPDGSVFVGMDTWQESSRFDYDLLSQDPVYAYAILSTESVGIVPGERITINNNSQKVGCCRYEIDPVVCRVTIWFANDASAYGDALHAGLIALIKETMRGVDYLGSYSGQVILQRANGTLDVVLDNPKIPPLTSVPIRVQVPNSKLTVVPGSRVTIKFEEGDPRKFVAELYQSGSGGKAVARVGDSVSIDSNLATWISQVTTAINALASGAVTAVPTIAGKITTGSPHLELP